MTTLSQRPEKSHVRRHLNREEKETVAVTSVEVFALVKAILIDIVKFEIWHG